MEDRCSAGMLLIERTAEKSAPSSPSGYANRFDIVSLLSAAASLPRKDARYVNPSKQPESALIGLVLRRMLRVCRGLLLEAKMFSQPSMDDGEIDATLRATCGGTAFFQEVLRTVTDIFLLDIGVLLRSERMDSVGCGAMVYRLSTGIA